MHLGNGFDHQSAQIVVFYALLRGPVRQGFNDIFDTVADELGTLTSVESAQEFAVAWNRIAEYFDALFTTEHSIDQLKQIILQLAVMGKIVPQDTNEE